MSEESALVPQQPQQSSIFLDSKLNNQAQAIASQLASSALVPEAYQGQKGHFNCMIAIEMANRMGLSPLQVMQNLTIVRGRPSWSAGFIIATIQSCGRFKDFKYNVSGEGDSLAVSCSAIDVSSGLEVVGPVVSLETAKSEGWARSNKKYQTMPEVMLRYRAASAFGRFYISDLLLGLEKVEDMSGMEIETINVEIEAPKSPLGVVNGLAARTEEPPEPAPDDSDDIF